jgi:hypothetical protein
MIKIIKETDKVFMYKENGGYCVSVEDKKADCFKDRNVAEEYYQHQVNRFNPPPPNNKVL